MFDEHGKRSDESKYPSIVDLKESRARILNATSPNVLRQYILLLEEELYIMKARTSGKIKHSVDRALKEIQGFKLHDKTRADVARWVQTIICNLNQQ